MVASKERVKPSPQTSLTLLEECAVAKVLGSTYCGSEFDGRRVQVFFHLTPEAEQGLASFRGGNGPQVDAWRFMESINWARTLVFSKRRAVGADAGR